MPLGIFSVPLLLLETLLQLRMRIDVLLIAAASCVHHKMSKPRRSRRLGKPLQQLQSQVPRARACATAFWAAALRCR